MLELLQDLWGVEDKAFDTFRDRHKAYVLRCRQTRTVPIAFSQWQEVATRPNSPAELKWQSMPNVAYHVSRLMLDGVLFRSDRSQKQKESKTDNSGIICYSNISYATGKQRKALQRMEKCYGRAQDFYLHFKYPPSKQQMQSATHKRRIDPYKVGVPFLIVAFCDWYMQRGENHEVTGLTQITPHPSWNNDCPLVKIQDCLSMNVVYWPANPFELVTDNSDMVVITHHEEIPVIFNVR